MGVCGETVQISSSRVGGEDRGQPLPKRWKSKEAVDLPINEGLAIAGVETLLGNVAVWLDGAASERRSWTLDLTAAGSTNGATDISHERGSGPETFRRHGSRHPRNMNPVRTMVGAPLFLWSGSPSLRESPPAGGVSAVATVLLRLPTVSVSHGLCTLVGEEGIRPGVMVWFSTQARLARQAGFATSQ